MSDVPVWWRVCVVTALVGVFVAPAGAWRGLAILVVLANGAYVIVRGALWLRRRLRLADAIHQREGEVDGQATDNATGPGAALRDR